MFHIPNGRGKGLERLGIVRVKTCRELGTEREVHRDVLEVGTIHRGDLSRKLRIEAPGAYAALVEEDDIRNAGLGAGCVEAALDFGEGGERQVSAGGIRLS